MIKIKVPVLSAWLVPKMDAGFIMLAAAAALFSTVIPFTLRPEALVALAAAIFTARMLSSPKTALYIMCAGLIIAGDRFSKIGITLGTLPVYAVEILMFTMLAAAAARAAIYKTSQLRLSRIPLSGKLVPFFLTGIVAFMSGYFSYADKIFTLREAALFYYALLYFAVPAFIKDRKELTRFLACGGYCGGALAVNFLLGGRIPYVGSFGYFYAGLISIYAVLVAGATSSSLRRAGLYALAGVLLVSFVFAEARAAWVGLFLSGGYLLFFVAEKAISANFVKTLAARVLIVVFLFASAGYFARPETAESVFNEFLTLVPAAGGELTEGQQLSVNNARWRLYVWRDIIDEWSDKPLFGWGLGKKFIPKTLVELDWGGSWRDEEKGFQNPHNSLLTILHNAGIAGLAAFAFFVSFFLWRAPAVAKRMTDPILKRIYIASAAAVVYVVGTSLFMVVLEGPYLGVFLWIAMGLAASAEIIASGERPS